MQRSRAFALTYVRCCFELRRPVNSRYQGENCESRTREDLDADFLLAAIGPLCSSDPSRVAIRDTPCIRVQNWSTSGPEVHQPQSPRLASYLPNAIEGGHGVAELHNGFKALSLIGLILSFS